MKKIFRKAITVLGSAALIGMTVGAAAAASYPLPFTSNSAIIVGSSAAFEDTSGAVDIAANIGTNLIGGGDITIEGGKGFDLLTSSNNFNLGDSINNVLPEGKLDKKKFEVALADGIYEDSENEDFDYTQKLYLADKSTVVIENDEYADGEPTLGMYFEDNENVMNYTITYKDKLNASTMDGTDLTIAGKDYYVLTATNEKIELLDTASTTVLNDGASTTVKVGDVSYDVSVTVSSSGARFTVNGQTTDKLTEGGYDKISGDVYVIAKTVDYFEKESATSSVEFSIGQGKITLEDGDEVKINTDGVDNFEVEIGKDGDDFITSINFVFNADDEIFLTGAKGYTSVIMPVFNTFSLAYGGVSFPETSEITELVSSEKYITLETEIEDGSLSIPILYRADKDDANFTGLGKDSTHELVVELSTDPDGASYNLTLTKDLNSRFVVTYIKGEDGYTYAFQLNDIDEEDGVITVDFDSLAGDSNDDISFDVKLGTVDLDGITLTLVGNVSDESVIINVSTPINNGRVYSDRIVTSAGLTVMIPSIANITEPVDDNYSISSWDMIFTEEDKDGDIAALGTFTATIAMDGSNGIHVSGTNAVIYETTKDDFWVGYILSELATKVEMDKSGDTNTFVVRYNGEEVTVDVKAVAGGVITATAGQDVGIKTYTDDQAASFTGMNLIVVGGSAINTIAAELLGGAYSEGDFTAQTGISAGQFLIEAYKRSTGETALLVAGYNAADTERAVTYLLNSDNTISTSEGQKVVKVSSTYADIA